VDEKLLKLSELPLLITTRKNLDTNPKQIKYWENFAAFIDWQDGKEYAKGIADQIPNSTIQVAYAPGRRFRGYVISDLHIDADMHINYLNGIIELWKSPARWVLLFCMMTIIGFIFLDNRAHQQSF
jgi:hypothetical protein